LPDALTHAPGQGGIVNLPASAVILGLMGLLVIGVRQSAQLNTALVGVKLLTIAVFIGIAAFHVNPQNWQPFMPYGWFDTLPDGKTVGVLAGASLVFFAYLGFDAVSTAAEGTPGGRAHRHHRLAGFLHGGVHPGFRHSPAWCRAASSACAPS
jgi:APA family basic amino acid/polyamine antiporter